MEEKKNRAAVQLGRLGGSVKSDAKKQSSSENGKKGGRPRKDGATKQSPEILNLRAAEKEVDRLVKALEVYLVNSWEFPSLSETRLDISVLIDKMLVQKAVINSTADQKLKQS